VTNWLYSWSSLTHILNFHSTCWHPIRQSTCSRQSIEQRNFYQKTNLHLCNNAGTTSHPGNWSIWEWLCKHTSWGMQINTNESYDPICHCNKWRD
jgi:hypothetical protein